MLKVDNIYTIKLPSTVTLVGASPVWLQWHTICCSGH